MTPPNGDFFYAASLRQESFTARESYRQASLEDLEPLLVRMGMRSLGMTSGLENQEQGRAQLEDRMAASSVGE